MNPLSKLTAIHKTKGFATILATLVFLPLIFLNIRHDHDWGGDFAQYLAQADNIAHFRAMGETGYVYNESYPSLAPGTYPPGFPLLISPLTGFYGNYIPPYNYLISIFLAITAVLSVMLMKQHFGLLTAIALNLIIYFNPYLVSFKSEVMADIPFSLMVAGFIILTQSNGTMTSRKWIAAGLVAGLATATKTAGASLLAALLLYAMQRCVSDLIRKKPLTTSLRSATGPIVSLGTGIGLSLLFSLIFMKGEEGTVSYLNTFSIKNLQDTLIINIYGYSEALRGFFIGMNTPAEWFGLLVGSAVLTFFITGLIIALANRPGLMEWTILVYVGMLLVYPYHHAGFRFLLPIAPPILLYAGRAVLSLKPGRGGIVLAIIVAIMMLWQYYPRLAAIQHTTGTIQEGPYAPEIISAFNHVKALTTDDALIVFNKPTVLARYTGRRSMSHKPGSTVEEISVQFSGKSPTHYLVYTGLPDPWLISYIEANSSTTELVWQDPHFRLYRDR